MFADQISVYWLNYVAIVFFNRQLEVEMWKSPLIPCFLCDDNFSPCKCDAVTKGWLLHKT